MGSVIELGVLINEIICPPHTPLQCTCLFVDGIWHFCPKWRLECVCTSVSSAGPLRLPLPFSFFCAAISPSFFHPSFSSCVCASMCNPPFLFECATAVVCLLTFSPLYKAERFMPNPTLNASRSFPVVIIILLFAFSFISSVDIVQEDKSRTAERNNWWSMLFWEWGSWMSENG